MDDTSGIIFLGTPHHGSASSIFGAMLASATWFLGSDKTLLLSLREHDPSLSNLVDRFDACGRQRGPNTPLRIRSFAENKSTYIFKWLCIGQVSKPEIERSLSNLLRLLQETQPISTRTRINEKASTPIIPGSTNVAG